MPDHQHFADGLADSIARAGSPLAVGLDPVAERLPASITGSPVERVERFSLGVIDAAAGTAAAIKLQSACYERLGSAGVAMLPRLIAHAREQGLLTILDAKRGDIGISSEHYAHAAGESDAVTVNGYLGMGALAPFLDRGLGVFVLVRTSNPDGDAFQTAQLAAGGRVCDLMAQMVAEAGGLRLGTSGLSSVGAVVGLTKASEGQQLREAMPDQVFLVPGLGAQGGSARDLVVLHRPAASDLTTAGVLATASRSIIYPDSDGPWQEAIGDAARRNADQVADALSVS